MEENATVTEIRPTPVRDFVRRHKTTIAVTATAITGMVAHIAVVNKHNEFLKEHDLYETFYSDPSDENL